MHYLTSIIGIDASRYSNNSQKIRVLTESWVQRMIFCPACGSALSASKNNSRACDFVCTSCPEEFELKSKKGRLGKKIMAGAYEAMITRMNSQNNPNLFMLQYADDYRIEHFCIVPRYFFTPKLIEKRKPLAASARRAGWVGCNIRIGDIPQMGRIAYIENGQTRDKKVVLDAWHATLFIEASQTEVKGWLLDTLNYIEKLNKQEFTLTELYFFEQQLAKRYPQNHHIKDKMRQQLQLLRDKGYLEFIARGSYRLTNKP